VIDATSSVGVTVTSAAVAATATITVRAVAIESWRNPAVAVSISTRIGGTPAGGEAGGGAWPAGAGAVGVRLEHATAVNISKATTARM
jgi:hypothetical protein